MSKVLKFGLAVAVVVGLSGLAINKILEEPTTACTEEVAELTKAPDALSVILLSPDRETVDSLTLNNVITNKTSINLGSPYLTIAALGPDGFTVYIKVLLEEGKTYSSQTELEIKQIKESMHKDKMKCSMNGKKFEIYRAKTMLEKTQKMSTPI